MEHGKEILFWSAIASAMLIANSVAAVVCFFTGGAHWIAVIGIVFGLLLAEALSIVMGLALIGWG